MGKAKLNIPMCAALILFLLTMISIHLTSGLFARYTATASGSDSARVAKFAVSSSIDKNEVTIDCAQTEQSGAYQITVNNQSEVAVKYVIRVILDQEVNDKGFWVKVGGEDGKNMVFTVDGPLAPGESRAHTLELGVESWHTVTSKTTKPGDESVEWTVNFDIAIDVEQVD